MLRTCNWVAWVVCPPPASEKYLCARWGVGFTPSPKDFSGEKRVIEASSETFFLASGTFCACGQFQQTGAVLGPCDGPCMLVLYHQ
jgi:hypothetical protein